MKVLTVIIISSSLLGLSACSWRDDFRERQQPYYLEYEPKPTFNMDSEQYVGDEVVQEYQGGNENKYPPLMTIPEIDNRQEMPYIPEHPVPNSYSEPMPQSEIYEYEYIE